MRSLVVVLVVTLASLTAGAQAVEPFRAADLSASPRMAKLHRDIQAQGASAVAQFWNELRQNGAPIIESIPGDEQHSLVTFVWQGSPAAYNVVIADGVAVGVGGVDPVNSEMTRIVHYQEFNGNHSYINWRGSFGDGLVLLLGQN